MRMLVIPLLLCASAHAGPVKPRAPDLDLALTSITGGYSQAKLGAAIDRAKPALAACYGAQLAKQPGLAGTLHLYFRISAAGTVTDALAGSLDETVDECIAGAIAKVEFAKPPKPVEVEYEIHLGRGSGLDLRLPSVSNGYPRKDVVDVVRRARPALLACYGARPPNSRDPSASLELEIAADGSVQPHNGHAIALSEDPDLDACLTGVVSKLAFVPPSNPPVRVLYVMVFGR